MPSTSHRRCQYQGPECMGTAHAGHDQCARCYFDYVKPALQAERQAMKGRRALKRAARRGDGVLANHAQQPGGTQAHLNLETRPSGVIRDAIIDMEIDRQLEGKTPEQQLETIASELAKAESWWQPAYEPEAEPESEPEPERQEHVGMRHFHKGGANAGDPSPTVLTEPEVQEVLTAYKDGMFVNDICSVCNIVTTTLYNIVREAGVPLRTHIQQREMAARRAETAPPRPRWPTRPTRPPTRLPYLEKSDEGTMEKLVTQSTPPVSNGKVEPAPTNGAVSGLTTWLNDHMVSGLTEWVVTYTTIVEQTESTVVAARSFGDAAAAVETQLAQRVGEDGKANVLGFDVISVTSTGRKPLVPLVP